MPIKKLLERNAFFIAIFFTIFIAFISLISLKGIPAIKVSNSDKFGHLFAYFLLCLSWLYAFRNHSQKKVTIYIIIVLIIYGILIEVLQGVLTTYRQADFFDILANSSGVILAMVFYKKLIK